MVGHDGGLGEALGFVVDGAETDGIDVAPVGLHLRMHLRVAVALGRGGMQKSGAIFAGEVESIDGAGGAYKEGFGTETGVVVGTGGRGEVEDEIDFAGIEGLGDVLLDEAEAGLALEVAQVGKSAGAQIVDADDGISRGKQRVTKMRAEKAGGSCDKNVS